MQKRKRYTAEYKREIVELVRRSKSSCRQVALEVGVNPNMLPRWVREADSAGGKAFPGAGTPRDEEVARLKPDPRGQPGRHRRAADARGSGR
jgi:transposase